MELWGVKLSDYKDAIPTGLPEPHAIRVADRSPLFPMHVIAVEPGARLLFLTGMADGNACDGDDRCG